MSNEIKIEFPYQIPSKEEFDKLPFDKYGRYIDVKENGDQIEYSVDGVTYQCIKKININIGISSTIIITLLMFLAKQFMIKMGMKQNVNLQLDIGINILEVIVVKY